MNECNVIFFKSFQPFSYLPYVVSCILPYLVLLIVACDLDGNVMSPRKDPKDPKKWGYHATATSYQSSIPLLTNERFVGPMVDIQQEHFIQGVEGFMREGKLFTSDSGFRIEDIAEEVQVDLWYGKEDTNVPMSMGEEIYKRMGGGKDGKKSLFRG